MKNLGLPETISWQMKFVFKCFKPSHFLLSPIVRVPLFLGGGGTVLAAQGSPMCDMEEKK